MDLNINLKLKQGKFTLNAKVEITDRVIGIFGPSGAGKSTLLHLISGLKRPDSGHITLNGKTLCSTEKNIFVPSEKRRIGVVFQDCRLFPHMNVEKNILFGARKESRSSLFAAVVNTLEITHLLERNPSNLSGGEKQRVAIARALLCRPRLLLLDEPFSGIDISLRSSLLPFINRVRNEFDCPMMIITHDLSDILYLTSSLMIVKKGEILGYGDFSDLIFHKECAEMIKHAKVYAPIDETVLYAEKAKRAERVVSPQYAHHSSSL